ncbi:MAG TPA: hypothetical protein VJP59_05640 [Gemmatimonadota bacterium]|nr:hypothetical protein [Gemmatimonadota bacterium]
MNTRIRSTGHAAAVVGLAALILAAPAAAQENALQSAVRAFGPDMTIPEGDDLSVRADFNGDGREDVAAVVRGPDRSALVVFHSTGDGYEMRPLYTRLPSGDVHLRAVPSGRHPVVGKAGGVQLKNAAVELIFPGRSSAMYVWEGGRYQVYGTESFYSR